MEDEVASKSRKGYIEAGVKATRDDMGRVGVKCIKILPDLRPGTSERLLIRKAGVEMYAG